MDFIEQKIKNSFDKIPLEFKKRVGYEVVTDFDKIDIAGCVLSDDNKLIFIGKNIDKSLQEYIDILVVKALGKQYGFTEEEAHKLLLEVSKK